MLIINYKAYMLIIDSNTKTFMFEITILTYLLIINSKPLFLLIILSISHTYHQHILH